MSNNILGVSSHTQIDTFFCSINTHLVFSPYRCFLVDALHGQIIEEIVTHLCHTQKAKARLWGSSLEAGHPLG